DHERLGRLLFPCSAVQKAWDANPADLDRQPVGHSRIVRDPHSYLYRSSYTGDAVIMATLAPSHASSCSSSVSAQVDEAPRRRRSRVKSDLSEITSDNFRPAAFIVGSLFVVFAIYKWFQFRPGVREPICIYDLALVVLGFGLYALCRRVKLA